MIGINILLGIILIVLTIIIHSFITRYIVYTVHRISNSKNKQYKRANEYWIAVIVLIIFIGAIFEAVIWAASFMVVGAIETFESALYFSIVTFTTLGYGDITLNEDWRLLASLEAGIGIIIFGWSTAIVMALVQKFFFKKNN